MFISEIIELCLKKKEIQVRSNMMVSSLFLNYKTVVSDEKMAQFKGYKSHKKSF